MPIKVTLDDDREYLEYSIQEVEAARMNAFLRNSRRWQGELRSAELPPETSIPYRQPKYTDPRTPKRYRK